MCIQSVYSLGDCACGEDAVTVRTKNFFCRATEDSGKVLEENWYDNGEEKQVDRWEEREDGSKAGNLAFQFIGVKFYGQMGRKGSGCKISGYEL